MRYARYALLFISLLFASASAVHAGEPTRQLWLYCPTNLQVDENVAKLEDLWRRAAKVGYSHVLLTDSKFQRLDTVEPNYHKNVEKIKKIAADLKIQIVPGVFPIGWSDSLLYHDPNLAAGLPVRDALFDVQDGQARLVADPAVSLPADFADLKKWGWHDDSVVSDGATAKFANLKSPVARVVKAIKVKPFRQYHISAKIKTQDFHGTPEIKAIGGDRTLNYNDLGVKPTQDWTEHHTVFNSLDHDEVNIYFGCWNGGQGTAWYSEPKLEEVGLVNVLRRPGAPVTVRRDGDPESKPLVEGKDYDKIVDPKMGNEPWAGEYTVWHEPPTIHTKLPSGTKLRVSYYHPMIIYGGSVMISLSEPKTLELLRSTAQRIHKEWGAKAYFMEHDEIRLFNWDAASDKRHLDAGAVLADNARQCIKILRDINPDVEIYAWNDMFDPHHNAVDNYYLVKGNIAGSWEGLDPKVIIANWNHDKRDQSLKFFADRGHRQLIAGFYDSPPEDIRGWLDSAAKSKAVQAVMYTTWQGDYSQVEKFAGLVKAHPWWSGASGGKAR